jgi:hypothetical protein
VVESADLRDVPADISNPVIRLALQLSSMLRTQYRGGQKVKIIITSHDVDEYHKVTDAFRSLNKSTEIKYSTLNLHAITM